MNTLEFHPYADLFPLIEGEEFDALVADIKANGLHEPIMLYDDGKILDGRNRYRACLKADIAPKFVQFRDIPPPTISPISYVISRNINRRHLTTQQRIAIAAELSTMKLGDNQHTAATDEEPRQNCRPSERKMGAGLAAQLMKVSTRSVGAAKQRMREDPEAHEKAKAGKLERKRPEPAEAKPRPPKTAAIDVAMAFHMLHGDQRGEFLAIVEPHLSPDERQRLGPPTVPAAATGGDGRWQRGDISAEASGRSVLDREWWVRYGHRKVKRRDTVEVSIEGGRYATRYYLNADEARRLAAALVRQADMVEPALIPQSDEPVQSEPEVEVIEAERVEVAMPGRMQRVAPLSDAEMVDEAPHPDADLRARLEAVIAKGTTDEVTFANSADVAYPALVKFLEGKTISYHDVRKIAAQIGARP
jgi:hypothetical protein